MPCDVNKILDELNFSKEEKEKLIQDVRADFPDDEMLFELHVIRAAHHFHEKQSKPGNARNKENS